MSSTPFLTQVDSRAAIHGSRDPLSLVPIWAAFGRRVVGNLTTASTSLRGFTTVLLGYYLVDRIQEKTPDEPPLSIFLKLEQLVGYCRVYEDSEDTTFRGSERVIKRLEDSSRVTISAEPRHQILGDQKTYGLWGLYSVASRTSGLLLPDRPALTPEATEFVQREYLTRLTRAGLRGEDALLAVVAPKSKELDLGRSARDLCHVVAAIHAERVSPSERLFYQRHLVNGGDEQSTEGQQEHLAALLDHVTTDDLGMSDVQRLIRLAHKHGFEELSHRLSSIERLEKIIVPAANLFGFLLRCDGRSLRHVADDIRMAWDPGLRSIDAASEDIRDEIARIAEAPEAAACLESFARDARAGRWSSAIKGLVDFNESVMTRRGGSAWVVVEGDRVKVRYREAGDDLQSPADLALPWRNNYFINSLHGIKRELARN